MSRIAGLVSDAPASLALRAVGGLLDRVGRHGDVTAALSLPGGTLGWTGAGPRGLARRGPLALALDGTLYDRAAHNRPELDDAALLLELVERHGLAGALARVNGDFAVALWDADERTLWLARDRVGIRPLYWARTSDGIAFASRPLALAALDGVGLDPDPRFLAVFAGSHYRLFDNAPERSPFARVAQVPAATVVRLHDGQAVATRYWTPAGEDDVREDDATLARAYRELLLDAVAIRVRAAERPAFTLSGGMDSSSVLGCAVESVGRRQHAFSTVYEDATYDESAEIVS
ncbi:MAG: asparagine synthase-related protein, partial [Thermoleophilia bacterium]